MEPKIREVQPLVQESWQRFERRPQDTALIQPVKKGAQAEKAKVGKEQRSRLSEFAKSTSKSVEPRELAEEVRQYLKEVNVQLNFKFHEDTGELIVEVVDHETNQVIRQLPPEQLLELREKLTELRGVLFSDKI